MKLNSAVAASTCPARAPRFLFYGSGRVSNYGCEAIVRGTVKLLRERWPDAVLRYASLDPLDDAARLADCPVEVVPRIRWPWSLQRHPRYSAWSLIQRARQRKAFFWLPNVDRLELLDDTDIVLSIGGDLYTPLNVGRGYPFNLLQFGEAVIQRGKRLVIWAASVGPFAKASAAENIVLDHLRRTHLITSREPVTTKYLREHGITNVVPCADPAYILATSHPPNRRTRRVIGVNLSMLSLKATAGSNGAAATIQHQSRTVAALMDALNAEVVFIPHVRSALLPGDDDRVYLERIHRLLPDRLKARATIMEDDAGFLGTKGILRQCDVVVAARMHCAINAVSELVPTILLAYSSKAIGMAEYVYGHRKWVVPVSEFTAEQAVAVLRAMMENRDSVISQLEARLPILLEDARAGAAALAALG